MSTVLELDRVASELASRMVLHPHMLPTYLTASMARPDPAARSFADLAGAMARPLGVPDLESMPMDIRRGQRVAAELVTNPDPQAWARRFVGAFDVPRFRRLLSDCIVTCAPSLASADAHLSLMFGENRRPPDDAPQLLAFQRAQRHLGAAGAAARPRWQALVVFCVARFVAVTASRSFHADTWTDFTLELFDAERNLLQGDGAAFAKCIARMNQVHFRRALPQLLAQRIGHGLAEAASNTADSPFFAELPP